MKSLNSLAKRGLLLAAVVLAGCATPPPTMYHWTDYQRNVYDYMKGDTANPSEQLKRMSAQADAARAANHQLPPGFRAHVAMIDIQLGQYDEAKKQFEAEKAAFPESAQYMDFLLKQMEQKKS
jgi:hypothetical protein